MNNIQQLIDSGDGIITLPPGEYKGSFYINRPCMIEGSNTTLWNDSGSVVNVKSEGVILKNIRIESVSESDEESYTICTEYHTECENVEVAGKTKGFGTEDNIPQMQRRLSVGKILSQQENSFIFDVYSPDAMSILETDMKDIKIVPCNLTAGVNKVKIIINPLPSRTYIYGDIVLKTKFNRRFFLSGSTVENGERCIDKVIGTIPDSQLPFSGRSKVVNIHTITSTTSTTSTSPIPSVTSQQKNVAPIVKTPENTSDYVRRGTYHLRRGERVYIDDISDDIFNIKMRYRGLFKDLDIDPYVFMLDSSGMTSCDDDFVYFGNRNSKFGGIFFNDDKTFDIDLRKVPQHIQRISFVYSIYNPDPSDNFSKVMDPYISISKGDKEIYRYTALELFAETTIIFSEIYRYNSKWKLNTIGQGYREGLKRLCSSYGLIVS